MAFSMFSRERPDRKFAALQSVNKTAMSEGHTNVQRASEASSDLDNADVMVTFLPMSIVTKYWTTIYTMNWRVLLHISFLSYRFGNVNVAEMAKETGHQLSIRQMV